LSTSGSVYKIGPKFWGTGFQGSAFMRWLGVEYAPIPLSRARPHTQPHTAILYA
jgi:hypothetical protein